MATSHAKGTILVTGANGGLGSAIVARIVSTPELAAYHGIYTVRDRSSAVIPALQSSNSHAHDVVSLDLAKLSNVREAAAALNERVAAGEIPPIRALVLNAGYQEMDAQRMTEDGFSMTFEINYLSQWLLALLLLQSMDKEVGRIVVVGSLAHDPYAKQNELPYKKFSKTTIETDTIDPIAKGTWSTYEEDPSWESGLRRYGAAKLFEVMMIGELQRRLDTDPVLSKISILGVDPGTMPTNIARHSPWFIRILMFQILFPLVARVAMWRDPTGNPAYRTPDKSAADVLMAAMDNNPVLGERPKGLYLNGSEICETSVEAKDPKKREIVWRDSVRYANLKEGETVLANWR
ncbi:putative short-chain dehydrogenase [Podospora appendiculata]|uniref:3beta-hydroxysteroid 3-dehydrogenase n=1 Tax=Podospora appendiculata TaxID=314037 RepID=A0AAE0XBC9_9PEZI|nr:putative short-chain dehydrogenase [Podospora appendiculata]